MVEQMTQRWHGESCRETCHSSLKLQGAEVSKLTEALGFGSPASQSLTDCFPASSPTVCGSTMEPDSVPSSAPQLLSGPVHSSQQMPSIWSHTSRNPSVDAFWTISLILGICPPQVSYLSALVKVYPPAFWFSISYGIQWEALGAAPNASIPQPTILELSLTLPAPYWGLQISAEPFQLIPACSSRRGREHKAVEVPSFRHLSTHLKQRPVRIWSRPEDFS